MGYWKCPKCGGENNTYEGTEIVTDQKQKRFVGVDAEIGMLLGQTGGGSSQRHVTVTKCRACDTLLSRYKDYLSTPQEQAQEAQLRREAEVRAKKEEPAEFAGWVAFWIAFLGGAIGAEILGQVYLDHWGYCLAWATFGWFPAMFVMYVVEEYWLENFIQNKLIVEEKKASSSVKKAFSAKKKKTKKRKQKNN